MKRAVDFEMDQGMRTRLRQLPMIGSALALWTAAICLGLVGGAEGFLVLRFSIVAAAVGALLGFAMNPLRSRAFDTSSLRPQTTEQSDFAAYVSPEALQVPARVFAQHWMASAGSTFLLLGLSHLFALGPIGGTSAGANTALFLGFVGTSTSGISLMVFFAAKRLSAPLRWGRVEEGMARRAPRGVNSLQARLLIAMAVPLTFVVVLLGVDASMGGQRTAPEMRWSKVADKGEVAPSLHAAVKERLAAGPVEGWTPIVGAGQGAGLLPMADGSILLGERASEQTSGNGLGAIIAMLLGLGLAYGLSRWLARDVSLSIESVLRDLERLAEGDFRDGQNEFAEDEFQGISLVLDRTRASLRETIGDLLRATDQVDVTASAMGGAVFVVSAASADQSLRIQQCHEWMASIAEQVQGIARFALDLTAAIEESSSSVLELGASGDELKDTASILTSKIDAVSNSLEQMVRSVKEVGETTDRLAEASEETSSSMEEMASAMRAVDTSAETTAELSRGVVDKAEIGQEKVVQTIVGMEDIREATDTAERVIRGLGDRTKEIGGILDVIDDVADETNLLALNAAIIAAQAGEQGRAFSVVADEIKELADRVLASTKEIGGLIRSVQEESENAIGAIEAGSASVMGGVDLSAEAGKTLEEITDASRESGMRIGEIVISVREQTRAASHVVDLMERVRDSAEQIGSASADQDRGNEVVYRTALAMREVAQQVHHTTEEQSQGFGRIRENVEGVRSVVEQITASIGEQSDACGQLSESLDQVFEGTRSTEDVAKQMETAASELAEQTQRLRADAARFQI
ncbi:MAG: methyl-accepting chemotaxis protein [Myxococcota bacterium]